MLFLEGAISQNPWGDTTFTRIKVPSHSNMVELVHTISHRIAQYLEKVGLIQRDMDNTFLDLPIDDEDSLLQLQAASVSYRIAVGKDAGKKVFSLQTLPPKELDNYGQLVKIAGFSLHAGGILRYKSTRQTRKALSLYRKTNGERKTLELNFHRQRQV